MTEFLQFLVDKLDDLKAFDVWVCDLRAKTELTDYLIVVSGNSTQHVRSIAAYVLKEAKLHAVSALGVEGEDSGEWVLLDFASVVVHAMTVEHRAYYALEELWSLRGKVIAVQPKIPVRV